MPALAQLADNFLAQPDGLEARVLGDITVSGVALPDSNLF